MRLSVTVLAMACAALTACSPSVPDSGAGVGFDDYDAYLAAKQKREASLTGSALPPPNAVSSEPLDNTGGTTPLNATSTAGSTDPADLAAETRAALDETLANSGEPVVHADPANPAPRTAETSLGISSENDFSAVGEHRTIQDDKALIEQNKAQYKVIQPTALPQRSGSGGPNIVQYALNSSHPVGVSKYRRGGFNAESKSQRNCAKYASADQAQVDFLARGGPSRDKLSLDPDGDGYACSWDPAPFRKAVVGAGGA